ncbi:MAG: tetratricopeptide repeat protein [Pirellulaceae bacterium]
MTASEDRRARAAEAFRAAEALIHRNGVAEAIAHLSRAVELAPDEAAYHNNLGVALSRLERTSEAVGCYERAAHLAPQRAEYQYNLGCTYARLGDLEPAVERLARALRLNPRWAEAHYNLGLVRQRLGALADACQSYQAAIECQPQDADAYNNLGIVYAQRHQYAAAVACFERALHYAPEHADIHGNLAAVLVKQRRFAEAIASYRRALEHNPANQAALSGLLRQLQQVCLWDEIMELSQRAIQALDVPVIEGSTAPFAPYGFLALPIMTTAEQQWRCARRWTEHCLRESLPGGADVMHRPERRPKERLTIGYLSADFRSHPIAHLVVGLFEQHDRRYAEVVGYSSGPDDRSAIRRRIGESVDRFVDIRDLSFRDAARRIAADGVDILVDLTGYTGDARTEIVVLRPAPIQVSFLGYAATMAAPFIDYVFVDDFVVPEDQQRFFTERLVQLPGCYYVNDSQRDMGDDDPSRQACGLPEDGFVFCCFNNNAKITPQVFDVWMSVLREMRESVLWLLEGNDLSCGNLRREAALRGVDPDRLVFAPRLPPSRHLARHRLADLFLDTLPYNAHTTASDALWVGCPVLTVAGQTFSARVAASQLRSMGLPELITYNLDDYRRLALRLAQDREMLRELRHRLALNRDRSGLFAPRAFARNVEAAYGRMWETFVAGQRPRPFRVLPGGETVPLPLAESL